MRLMHSAAVAFIVMAYAVVLGTPVAAQIAGGVQPAQRHDLQGLPRAVLTADQCPAVVAGNMSFEFGLSCWKATGSAFANALVRGGTVRADRVRTEMQYAAGGIGGDYWHDLAYPIGVKGNFWIGTYENGQGDVPTGQLVSNPFPLVNRYVSFLMGGGADPNIYVSLQILRGDAAALLPHARPDEVGRVAIPGGVIRIIPGGNPPVAEDYIEVERISNSENSEEMKRYWFDILGHFNVTLEQLRTAKPRVRLVIVDSATGAWGHINVDDFILTDELPAVISIPRGPVRINFDQDHPVWGFADTHTHPAAHLGFGGKMIVGDPSLLLPQTYATSVCTGNHGGPVLAMGPNKSFLSTAVALADPHFCWGAPDYVGYPRFNVKLYSGYHPEFFRRAFDGGERLVVANAVNTQYLATRLLGTGISVGTTTDDHSQALKQVKFISDLVTANNDFMEIARSPAEARRIILSNKMAVVLGVELDNFGDFKDQDVVWQDNPVNGTLPLVTLSRDLSTAKSQLADVIAQYKAAGVSQVTATHYVDGLFGGVPVMRWEPMAINVAYTNKCINFGEGKDLGVALNIGDYLGFGTTMEWLLLNGVSNAPDFPLLVSQCFAQPGNQNATGYVATINSQDLTPRGTELFLGLMRAGMLINSEHTSFQTKKSLFSLARPYGYPIMSSHTDPTSLGFRPLVPTGTWKTLDDAGRTATFGTSNAAYLADEFSVLDSDLDAIRNSGGTVGIFTVPFRKQYYLGSWRSSDVSGVVRNNNDGSSKSWAQVYLYVAERMGGRGVALASDRAGIEQIGPRFGPYAAWALQAEIGRRSQEA